MRLPTISTQLLLISSLHALQIRADTISLTQFQQISGFPAGCSAVYDGIVNGCTSDDFRPGPCSQACANGLRDITRKLSTACSGIAISPTTLIGLFLRDKGVAVLCPKIAPSSAPSSAAPSSAAASSSSAAPTSTSTSTINSATSTTSTPASSSLSPVASTTDSTQSTTSSDSVQTSVNIVFTSTTASSSTATSLSNGGVFGGDIGNLNGQTNGASSVKTTLLTPWIVVIGLAMGALI